MVIILDPLIISNNSRNFQSRYHFRLDSHLPSFISTQTVSLFPGVVCVISNLSKKLSINSSTSSLNSSFFLPELLSAAIRRFNFFCKSSNHLNLLLWTEWEWSFSLMSTSVQNLFYWKCWRRGWCCFWGWRFTADLQLLWHSFFRRYSLKLAVSFFLNTLYSFGSRYFLLSLPVFFLAASLALYRSHFFRA